MHLLCSTVSLVSIFVHVVSVDKSYYSMRLRRVYVSYRSLKKFKSYFNPPKLLYNEIVRRDPCSIKAVPP
jgi:hypothetical protein